MENEYIDIELKYKELYTTDKTNIEIDNIIDSVEDV